jgi:16S rRNA processing protein RimM
VPERELYCTVARLVRPRGNRGELEAELETDGAGWFGSAEGVLLWDGAARRIPARVVRAWQHKGRVVLQFEGIHTISQAEALAGWEVQVPLSARPPAPAGRVYVSDLIGCEVVEAATGRPVGVVRGLLNTGGTPLLEVRKGEQEILIPFAAFICVEVDAEARRIRVNLPEGLEDLNAVRGPR